VREGEEVCVVDGEPGKCRSRERGNCCVCQKPEGREEAQCEPGNERRIGGTQRVFPKVRKREE